MNNSDFIQLSCELAHNRVEEADTSYIIENEGEGQYTEDGQELFNDYYDYYQNILRRFIIIGE
jgi:hypothetical protein